MTDTKRRAEVILLPIVIIGLPLYLALPFWVWWAGLPWWSVPTSHAAFLFVWATYHAVLGKWDNMDVAVGLASFAVLVAITLPVYAPYTAEEGGDQATHYLRVGKHDAWVRRHHGSVLSRSSTQTR